MKYIVTGGAGFIGSNLVDALVEQGHKVYVWDNFCTGKAENLNHNINNISVEWLDISQTIPDIFSEGIDAIFHLAAEARIQPSFKKPLYTHNSNVTGTVHVLELARINNCKVIYAGTSSLYHDLYANPYTFTKGLAEQYCQLYNKIYGVPVAIARFFNVYGPRQIEDGDYATVIGIFEKQKRNNQPLTVTGTGEKRRDFTHVKDIVSGLIAMSKDNWNCEIFNLGSGTNYSINEVAQMFNHPITYLPNRPGEAETTLADISFSKEKLGWEPTQSLRNYIESIKWN